MRNDMLGDSRARVWVVALVCVVAGCSGSDGARLAEFIQQLIRTFAVAAGVCVVTGILCLALAVTAPRSASAPTRRWVKAALIVACVGIVMAGCAAPMLANWDRLEESQANKAVGILMMAGFVLFLCSLPVGFAAWVITVLVMIATVTATAGQGTRRQWLMLALASALSAVPSASWALLLKLAS